MIMMTARPRSILVAVDFGDASGRAVAIGDPAYFAFLVIAILTYLALVEVVKRRLARRLR